MVEYNPEQIREIRRYLTAYGKLVQFAYDHVDRHDKDYWSSLEECLKNCKKIPEELRPDDYEERIAEGAHILNFYENDRNP